MKPLGIAGVTVTLFQIGADPAQAATRTIFATTVTDSKGGVSLKAGAANDRSRFSEAMLQSTTRRDRSAGATNGRAEEAEFDRIYYVPRRCGTPRCM
jgi:hypothetical protein